MTLADRIKEIRKQKNLKQAEFGDRLGVKEATVTSWETGARNPSESVLLAICREFDVREEWLKTGEGDTFKKMSPEEEVASYVSDLLEDDTENPLYEIIKEIMRTYNELSPKSQEIIRDFSQRLMDNIKKEG